MSNATKAPPCPAPELLKEFLLGKLEPPRLAECESHVSDCDQCHETLRGLNADDTFSSYVSQAIAERPETENSPEIKRLIDRLIDPVSVQQLVNKNGFTKTGDLDGSQVAPAAGRAIPRAELELLADRAAEVLRCLTPAENILGQIGQYELLRLIGAGSSGVVFQANDTSLSRVVALKVLRPSLGPLARQRFLAEAKAAAAIEHANVVTIYQVGEQDRLAYMAMQWVPGETLDTQLQTQSLVEEKDVRHIAREICGGLQAAHGKQMIHRDIKPANIWVCEDQSIKILDFGLARIADDDSGLTATGMLAGTPNYMSPEQARGQELDGRTDLFSLGCLMYRLLTGRLPFGAATVLGTLQSIQHHRPVPVQTIRPDVSDDVADITMALLEKQPANRPESAEQVIQLLSQDRSSWSVPINRYEPQLHSHQENQPEKTTNVSGDQGSGHSKTALAFWGIAGMLLLMAAGFFGGPHIIRIATNQGELVIETEDGEDVKIEILRNGEQVKLLDVKSQSSLNITSGDYQIIASPTAGAHQVEFDVSPTTVSMTRGGKQVVRVTQKQPGAPTNARPDAGSQSASANIAASQQLETLLQRVSFDFQKELDKKLFEESEIKKKYGAGHPKIESLTQSIQQLRNRLAEVDKKLAQHRQNNVYSAATPVRKTISASTDFGLATGGKLRPTYNGQPFEHWMQIAKTDRHTPTFAEAIAACAELAETDAQLDELVAMVRATARQRQLGVFGRFDDDDMLIKSCLATMRRLPPAKVVAFVRQEMVEGNDLSRGFCSWLSASAGISPGAGEIPGLSGEQRQELADAYIGSTSSVLKQAYELNSNERLPLLRYFVSYTNQFTRDQLTVRDPQLKEMVDEIAPVFKREPSLDEIKIMLPLLMRYGVDVQNEIIKCEREIFKNTAVYNWDSELIRVLAQYRLLPWPGDLGTESEYSPTGSEMVDLRLRILARHIEVVCSKTEWTNELPIDGVLNSIYQNLQFASEDAKNDTADVLQRTLSKGMFSQKKNAQTNNATLNLPRQRQSIEALISICNTKGSVEYRGQPLRSYGNSWRYNMGMGGGGGGFGGNGFGGGGGGFGGGGN